jgi:hypothetical protein
MTTFEFVLEQLRRRKRRRRLARLQLAAKPLPVEKPKVANPIWSDAPVKTATEMQRHNWATRFLSRQFISATSRARHREIVKRYLSALP